MARARAEPDALVIGIDASAAAMAETSRRAAKAPDRGGTPNALFVVAAAERLPSELHGIADELTILFPWGSLLRGALAIDGAAAADGIACLLSPAGHLTIIVSLTDRDNAGADLPRLEHPDAAATLAGRWAHHGLDVQEFRPATAAEIRATGSSWARRLAAGRDRPAWWLELRPQLSPERSTTLDAD